MTKAIIYARVSPKGRRADRSGFEAAAESLANQLDLIHLYCDQHSLEVVGEYSDEFRSGSDEERPGMWAAVNACKAEYVMVVWRYERLARSVFLEESIRRELKRAGAALVAVDGHNGSTPEDDLVRGILSYVAEYERRLISKRTKVHMLHRQKSGELMSHKPPFGTRIDPDNPKRIISDEKEMRQLHDALVLRVNGMKTYREIAKHLNAKGELFRGKPWNNMNLRRGLIRWCSGQLPGDPPPESLQQGFRREAPEVS